jgi:putative transposase
MQRLYNETLNNSKMSNDLFRNKYRIPSARAQWWDYKLSAPYFVTICTRAQLPMFGQIENGEMMLNEMGRFAQKCWDEISCHFPTVELIHFVVMPNHIHGLLIIKNNTICDNANVETLHATSLHEQFEKEIKQYMSNISPKKGSLSTIIRSYKSAVTKYANENNKLFDWQPRFYDRIVRDDEEFIRIYEYISNNPKRWGEDEMYLK